MVEVSETHTLPTGHVIRPGIYDGIPEDLYHADAALSSSGARLLLAPSTPEHFAHNQTHGQAPKKAFDIGTGVHTTLLGVGQGIVEVKADSWRTNAAKDAAKAARAVGGVPLLTHDVVVARAMVDRVRRHPAAGPLFAGAHGVAEQSAWWWSDVQVDDDAVRVWRRARFDWLTVVEGRPTIVDLKTTGKSAAPQRVARQIDDYGYHVQAAWYMDAWAALGGDVDVDWLWVTVETDPPHMVSVTRPDHDMLTRGRELAVDALGVYARCVMTGEWPGYPVDVVEVSLPRWAR